MRSKKKMIALALSTIFVVASASTATYAWYISNTSASASEIKGEADSKTELILISKDGFDWKAKLDISDLISNSNLNPVQISGDNSYKLLNNETATKDKDYASFTLYFKVMDLDYDATFDLSLNALLPESTEHPKLIAPVYRNNPTRRDLIVHLAEALAIEVTPATDADKAVMSSSKYYKFCSDRDIDGRDAIYYYNNYMGLTGDDMIALPDGYNDNYESDTLYGTTVISQGGAPVESRKVTLFDINATDNLEFKLTFNFYLEGWDIDCFSVITGKTFETALNFDLTRKE